jgi:hypothetical protein
VTDVFRSHMEHPQDLQRQFKQIGTDGAGNPIYAQVLALEPASIGGGSGGAVTIADGADVAQGTTTDASTANTLVGILKAIKAAVQGTLTVGGTVTSNAGTNLNTSALALDATLTNATQKTKLVDTAGTNVAAISAANALKVDGSAVTQPVDTELPAAAALADATANPTVPSAGSLGMVWNGTTWDRWNGRVQGDVADAAADSGNPVKVGGKFNATQPTYTDGQRGNLQLDSRGNVRIQVQSGVTVASVQTPADGQGAASGLVVSSKNMLFNGATDDRQRGNINTTTGDSGAKTANFLGATQTAHNARGAAITILLGTVTGTITTFQTGLQFSYDGGTTWLPISALGANMTTPASGNTIVWYVYPGAGAVTPAASGGVAAPTQWNQMGIALPRNWRVAMTIAGTSPSITITSISVNYIV